MRVCDECGIEIRKDNKSGFCLAHGNLERGQVKREFKAKVEVLLSNRVERDPMVCCGVRQDLHAAFGCGRIAA